MVHHRRQLEDYIIKNSGNGDKNMCNWPLNHKQWIVDVELLEQLSIPYFTARQQFGDIVVSFSGVCH